MFVDVGWGDHGWQVAARSKVILLFVPLPFFCKGCILPDVQLFVPTDSKEARSLHFLLLRIKDTDQCSDFCINLRLYIRAEKLLKLLAIREIPNLDCSISRGRYKPSGFHVKGARGYLRVEGLGEF